MAYDHNAVIQRRWEVLESERLAAANDYESARLAEDEYSVMSAANRYEEAEQRIATLNRIAGNFATQQHRQAQQQQHNPMGLSRAEQEMARICGLSDQQYSANKDRMHRMKANGEIQGNDQGKVFK